MLSLFSGGSCWAGRSSAARTIPTPSSWPTQSSPPCSAVLLAWRDGQSILRSTGRGLDQILRRKADHLAELGVTQGLGRDELQPARVMGQPGDTAPIRLSKAGTMLPNGRLHAGGGNTASCSPGHQFTFAEAFFRGFASRFPNMDPTQCIYKWSEGRLNTNLVFCSAGNDCVFLGPTEKEITVRCFRAELLGDVA